MLTKSFSDFFANENLRIYSFIKVLLYFQKLKYKLTCQSTASILGKYFSISDCQPANIILDF